MALTMDYRDTIANCIKENQEVARLRPVNGGLMHSTS